MPPDPALEILSYDIGRTRGRIIARSGGGRHQNLVVRGAANALSAAVAEVREMVWSVLLSPGGGRFSELVRVGQFALEGIRVLDQ